MNLCNHKECPLVAQTRKGKILKILKKLDLKSYFPISLSKYNDGMKKLHSSAPSRCPLQISHLILYPSPFSIISKCYKLNYLPPVWNISHNKGLILLSSNSSSCSLCFLMNLVPSKQTWEEFPFRREYKAFQRAVKTCHGGILAFFIIIEREKEREREGEGGKEGRMKGGLVRLLSLPSH